MLERLDAEGLLPAITFIFSRAGCDAAVAQCLRAGLRLLDRRRSAAEIRAFVEARCADIPPEDLHVLGYYEWLEGLERGIAAHHAGMLPTFKEVVEELFVRGLVKAVFATETLALGINMPARSVVLERLVKWNGETPRRRDAGGVHPAHRPGRAARHRRRGPRGRGVDARARAGGAGRARLAPAPIRCAPASGRRTTWRSTWSARSAGPGPATCCESSFAQFQADRAVVGLARQVRPQRGGASRATARR